MNCELDVEKDSNKKKQRGWNREVEKSLSKLQFYKGPKLVSVSHGGWDNYTLSTVKVYTTYGPIKPIIQTIFLSFFNNNFLKYEVYVLSLDKVLLKTHSNNTFDYLSAP